MFHTGLANPGNQRSDIPRHISPGTSPGTESKVQVFLGGRPCFRKVSKTASGPRPSSAHSNKKRQHSMWVPRNEMDDTKKRMQSSLGNDLINRKLLMLLGRLIF